MSTSQTGCGASTHKGGRWLKQASSAHDLDRLDWRAVRFFAVVDLSLLEALELYVRREDAERMLAELLRDEPSWESLFQIEEIELGELSRN